MDDHLDSAKINAESEINNKLSQSTGSTEQTQNPQNNGDINAQQKAQDELLKSKNRLELMSNIASEINSCANLDSIINNTVQKISEFFGDFRIVYSTIDNNGLMRCKISRHPESMDDITGFECDLSSVPEYLRALNGKEVIISEDITKDERFREFQERLLSIKVKALVDVPVFDSEGLAGMVCIDSPEPYKWTEYEIETLKEASENLSLAIKKAQLEKEQKDYEKSLQETLEDLSKKNRNEEIISTVAMAVHQSIDLTEVMNNAVESMNVSVEGVDYVAIYMVEGDEAVLKAHRGLTAEYIEAAGTIPYGRGLIWKTILDGEPMNVPEIDQDTVVGPAGRVLGIKSCKSSPVRFEDRVVGAMNIASSRKHAFGKDEVKLLETVSKQIEVAIKNARQAEALRQSEERYRALFDQSPMGVYIFDKDFKITNCNNRMEEILDTPYEHIVGIDISAFESTRIFSLIKEVFNGQPGLYEGLCEVSSGPVRPYVCVRLTPLRDEKQNVVGGMAVVEDISERRLAEEKLSIQEKRIRSLYEISAEPGFGIDQQIIQTLKTGCDMLGLDIGIIGHVVDKVYTVLYCFDQSNFISQGLKFNLDTTYCSITLAENDVVALDHVEISEYRDHPSYKEFKLETYIGVPLSVKGEIFGTINFSSLQPREVPFNNADKEIIRLMGRWVSTMIERKQTEVMLSDKEELYRTLVENAHDLIIETKIDGTVVYMNLNHKNLLGYDVPDLMGKSVFDLIHKDDLKPVTSEFMRALMSNSAAHAIFRFKHKNGEWRWLESAGKSFKTSSGEVRWVIDSRDITERKRTEEQVQKSLREKESLLREIHHRVKNNLQVISSLLSLQSDYAEGTDPSRLFDESQNRISAIALIHEQLYQSADLAEINIGEYLANLTDNLLTVYGDEGSNVSVEFNTDDLAVDIDTAIPCGLIINELFSNCLKHAFKCREKDDNQKEGVVNVGFNSDSNGQYILSVADNGCGLPPGLDFRETETLGLQLVCTLADQLNGELEFTCDKGTRFDIRFPNPVHT